MIRERLGVGERTSTIYDGRQKEALADGCCSASGENKGVGDSRVSSLECVKRLNDFGFTRCHPALLT